MRTWRIWRPKRTILLRTRAASILITITMMMTTTISRTVS
ncbi:hypothetical protein X975_07221, partial [Stegodyphus mimosarum]